LYRRKTQRKNTRIPESIWSRSPSPPRTDKKRKRSLSSSSVHEHALLLTLKSSSYSSSSSSDSSYSSVAEMWEEKKLAISQEQPLDLCGEEEFGPQPLPKISVPVNYGVTLFLSSFISSLSLLSIPMNCLE